jgi:hypothetical protein
MQSIKVEFDDAQMYSELQARTEICKREGIADTSVRRAILAIDALDIPKAHKQRMAKTLYRTRKALIG